jgi:nucleoid-associated protein YgaU
MLLRSVTNSKKPKIYIFTIICISILSLSMAGLYLNSNNERKILFAENMILNDSINKIRTTKINGIKENTIEAIDRNHEVKINYIVRKGDYPYKIAEFFYNDGSKYKQIEADNNLKQPYVLRVGQVLIIKISED